MKIIAPTIVAMRGARFAYFSPSTHQCYLELPNC